MPVPNSNSTNVYFNGMCHWFRDWDGKTFYVVSFNLSNELFFTTPVDWHARSISSLMMLNGYIALLTDCYDAMSVSISILGEIGVKESWTRLFEFDTLSCMEGSIEVGKKGNFFLSKKKR